MKDFRSDRYVRGMLIGGLVLTVLIVAAMLIIWLSA
ncbi:hypothetical protein J2X36_005255 [Methylobacterium sp. BE186]|nr:hypothetical protein [Methylobacterium sp. BE186]